MVNIFLGLFDGVTDITNVIDNWKNNFTFQLKDSLDTATSFWLHMTSTTSNSASQVAEVIDIIFLANFTIMVRRM